MAGPNDSELLWQSYLGLSVLETIFKRHGIDGGRQRTEALLRDIEAAHPEFPGRSALRTTGQGEK